MRYQIVIRGCPVLINDILRVPARHQSRIKKAGKKGKLGYQQLGKYFVNLPSFNKPVKITITIYQTKKNPIDIDSVNKTLLDALKFFKIIIDDNHQGISKLTCVYAKGYHPEKKLKVSFIE